jgi:acyl carrier protein
MISGPTFNETFDKVLRKHLRLVATDEAVPREATLVSAGLDSIGTISLLFDLEEAFDVALPGAMLKPEIFRTRASLESAIASLLGINPMETS